MMYISREAVWFFLEIFNGKLRLDEINPINAGLFGALKAGGGGGSLIILIISSSFIFSQSGYLKLIVL